MDENTTLDVKTKEAVWVPPELKKQIRKVARKNNYKADWRYIAMIHNNFVIHQNEQAQK